MWYKDSFSVRMGIRQFSGLINDISCIREKFDTIECDLYGDTAYATLFIDREVGGFVLSYEYNTTTGNGEISIRDTDKKSLEELMRSARTFAENRDRAVRQLAGVQND